MSLDPPKVMLEQSFLAAVADPQHTQHELCAGAYLRMVREYEHERVLLVAVGDHLRTFDIGATPDERRRALWFVRRPRTNVFAPVDPLHVAWQHERAVDRMDDMPAERKLTLLMCERHKVRRIATLDEAYAEYDLQLIDLSDRVEAPAPDSSPAHEGETAADAG